MKAWRTSSRRSRDLFMIGLAVATLTGSAATSSGLNDGPYSASDVADGVEVNTSHLDGDQAEPAIAVAPRNPLRIVTTAIDFGKGVDYSTKPGRRNVYVSSDRGQSWSAIDTSIQIDFTVVADHPGTFWVAGLAAPAAGQVGYDLRVARIPAGEDGVAATVILPKPAVGVARDKPMIAIDNSTSSPTNGRLYAVWNELGSNGYLAAFLTFCDTRVNDAYVPARCDAAVNWASPFQVVPGNGWIWAPDVATGPNGEVYIVWVDQLKGYAIIGTMCSSSCSSSASFTSTEVIAHPVPPTTCAPAGSRIRQTASLDVDISPGPNRGRVYVTWVSLSLTGIGCGGQLPTWTQLDGPMDAHVASEFGRLPGPTGGTKLYVDGDEDREGRAGSRVSDEFFPNVAVDEQTGETWVSFYSTRLDESRKASHVYIRRLGPDEGVLSALTRVSNEIDLSGGDPGTFYYGDYAGLDVVDGWPYPVWTGKGIDKDIFTWIPSR